MIKRPRDAEAAPEPVEGPEPNPPQPSPPPSPMPPRPAYGRSAPSPLDATDDANMTAVITSQLALIASQWIEASYRNSQLPPDVTTLPVGAPLQSISDTLAGASRALGAFIAQCNTLAVQWPPPPITTTTTGVSGNGGTP